MEALRSLMILMLAASAFFSVMTSRAHQERILALESTVAALVQEANN